MENVKTQQVDNLVALRGADTRLRVQKFTALNGGCVQACSFAVGQTIGYGESVACHHIARGHDSE